MSRRELNNMLSNLQGKFPCLHPVRLRLTRKMDDKEFGHCEEGKHKGEQIIILTLNASLCSGALFVVLIHEYAHAMDWRPDHVHCSTGDHPPSWGINESTLWTYINDEQFVWG